MSEPSESISGYPEEPDSGPSLPERLKNAANEQEKADTHVKKAERHIEDSKQQINDLQSEVREDEAGLRGLILKQQSADNVVNNLLLEVEKEYHLKVRRIQPTGPVVQGGTAKFQAVHDKLPEGVKVSWDTGGCPFIEGIDDTITVDTSSVATGDYDISASLVLGAASATTASSSAVSTSEPLPPASGTI